MNKKKLEMIITAALVVILVIAGIISLRPKGKRASKKNAAGLTAEKAYNSYKHGINYGRLSDMKKMTDKISWDRNPFIRGYLSGAPGSAAISLTGIIWDAREPQAIIGETVVRQGDLIGKYKIMKINKDSVTIKSSEEELILRIWEE